MIKSMTGYGNAEGQLDGATYTVEIKTVNNRFFKSVVKLPDQVAFLEEEIERLLRDSLERGMVNYSLRVSGFDSQSALEIDEQSLRAYSERLMDIGAGLSGNFTVNLSELLLLPGVMKPAVPDQQQADRIRDKVMNLSTEALGELIKMRSVEGSALAADLEDYCSMIKQSLDKIKQRKGTAKAEYNDRLKRRVNELLSSAQVSLDETTLAREVAIFAERSDINEELSRMSSHLDQFADICENQSGPAGRRLDFLAQELLREANTIGSKSSDLEIAHWVVDVKCQIDRIKEQVQNVE